MVKRAFKKVKSHHGSAGVGRVSLDDFRTDLENNQYKLWNRLSSGSYLPPSVREESIPRSNGKQRKLGIPTVGERVAQQVIKDYLEPLLEAVFHDNSYGYRPLRSAHQAVEAVRANVGQQARVIDMDIKSYFDEVDHEVLQKALDRHVAERWITMYMIRWQEAPVKDAEGQLDAKAGKGTPQGGVISPLLAHLYLHYTLDKWKEQQHKDLPFVRYADAVIVHCNSEAEAKEVLMQIKARLKGCHLRLNEEKTKIVYCQDYRREKQHYVKKFDFPGLRFQARSYRSKRGGMFLGYGCAIIPASTKRIASEWKKLQFHLWTQSTLADLAHKFNPMIGGIINYYGRFTRKGLEKIIRIFHFRLVKWVLNKYKRFRRSYKKACVWLRKERGFS